MTKWKEGAFEKLKARALGEYHFKPNQFGENGPQAEDTGYVITVDLDNSSFGSGDIIYKMLFENFPGTYFIGFDYTGEYKPYQEALFTTEK